MKLIRFDKQTEQHEIIIIAVLLGICCIPLYFHYAGLEIACFFTHLFYIPVILSAIWWKRKGLVVAVLLAFLLFLSHSDKGMDVLTFNHLVEASMYIISGTLIAFMTESTTKSQKKVTHLNAVLSAIRNVNQLIIREKNYDRLIQGTCDALVETRGYSNAWILLVNENYEYLASARSGPGENFLQMEEKMMRGEFTRSEQNVFEHAGIRIIRYTAADYPDRPLAGRYGDKVAMNIRLEYMNCIYGILSVSILAEMADDADEQALFCEVAGDIAFALHGGRQEEERKQLDKELRELKEKHKTLRKQR